MSQKLIDYADLADRGINASMVTLWRWEKAGKFPKRVRISHLKVAWVEDEVDQHIAARIAARPAPRSAAA
ncbi:helix-turn-helix transcriptional regulator [Nitrobacter sp. JJSN]|uniref:helix-turn-helix transcriptional regulator n=1 Tax=Nitrobacter sp. JJSN TaxID=3453033 RepID=UPI003F76DBB7